MESSKDQVLSNSTLKLIQELNQDDDAKLREQA